MVVLGLITDRTQENVDYLRALSRKGWANMTSYERAIWTGDPLTASNFGYSEPVNLLPNNVSGSDKISLVYRNSTITAIANEVGNGLYVPVIIGDAKMFTGKTITLSAESVPSNGRLQLVWYSSADSFKRTDCTLYSAGAVTVKLDTNNLGMKYLAMFISVTATNVGDRVVFSKVMLEPGDTRHDYVPYTPVLPTMATKGAYNYSDLNRVERAVEELSEQWNLGLETKTNWTLWDVPTASDMSRFRGNLAVIGIERFGRDVIAEVPYDLSKMTYAHANEIERLLLSASDAGGENL